MSNLLPMAPQDMVFRAESNQNPLGTEQRQAVLDKPVFGTDFTLSLIHI